MENKLLHRLFIFSALTLSVCLLYWSARFMWADVQAMPARNIMNQWEKTLHIENIEEWERASAHLHTAFELNPLSADYAMDLGRLYEWQALQQRRWTQHAHQYREKAIYYFRIATQLRPSWGFAWVHLVQSKISNQELDEEAIAALEKAMVLAPWEIGVQSKVISIGLILWPDLSEDMQQQLSRALERAVQLQPRAMIQQAVQQAWVERIKPLLNDENDLNYLASLLKIQNKEQ